MVARSLACDYYLHEDEMLEILHHLPAKVLLEFKHVNKSWYNLIMNPFFILLHCDFWSKFEGDNVLMVGQDTESMIRIIHPGSNKWEHTGVWLPGRLNTVGASKGLICLTAVHNFSRFGCQFLVMNPCVKQSKIISRKLHDGSQREEYEFVSVGFGFSHKHHDFKIVRVKRVLNEDSGLRCSTVDIYSLYNNSWRKINCSMNIMLSSDVGILSGNSLYWISDVGKDITVFNLDSEKFFTIPLPSVKLRCTEIECWGDDSVAAHINDPKDGSYGIWTTCPNEKPGNPGVYDFSWRRENLLSPNRVTDDMRGGPEELGQLGFAKFIRPVCNFFGYIFGYVDSRQAPYCYISGYQETIVPVEATKV